MRAFFLLFTFIFIFVFSTQAASSYTTEDDRHARFRGDHSAEDAYEFGLLIQKLVREKDLEGLFALVDGELKHGPRRKFALSLSFNDLFNEEWVNTILASVPENYYYHCQYFLS